RIASLEDDGGRLGSRAVDPGGVNADTSENCCGDFFRACEGACIETGVVVDAKCQLWASRSHLMFVLRTPGWQNHEKQDCKNRANKLRKLVCRLADGLWPKMHLTLGNECMQGECGLGGWAPQCKEVHEYVIVTSLSDAEAFQ